MKWLALCLVLAGCGGDRPDEVMRAPDGGVAAPNAGDAPVMLPAHCPCPLGSYCELASNTCKLGCLGNDHCPSGQRCDTTTFQCAHTCMHDEDCANHLACVPTPSGVSICKGCAYGWANCNNLPDDGCEAALDTLNDCGACGRPATTMCYVDRDGDGYTDPAAPMVRSCVCRDGLRSDSKGKDCDDNDWYAHPGQTGFFAMPRKSGGFDYDCDGLVTRALEFPANGACQWPCDGKFWRDAEPACGASGRLVSCYQWDSRTCDENQPVDKLQTCR